MPVEVYWSALDIPASDEQAESLEATRQAKAAELKERRRSAKTAALSQLAAKAGAPPQALATPHSAKPLRTAVKQEEAPGPRSNGARAAIISQPLAPLLDLASICTAAPRDLPERKRPRLYHLEHCPVFRPTIADFAKPLEYIERIARENSDMYGIVKIIPPDGWRPPFSLDTRTFKFRTRLQKLNSMEASARANVNFLEQLYLYHRQQGRARIEVPVVGSKPLDLWRLRREVGRLGGAMAVGESRQWPQIAKAMAYDAASAGLLQRAFDDIVAPFEDYLQKTKVSVHPASPLSRNRMSSRMGAGASAAEAQAASAELAQVLALDDGRSPGTPDLSPSAALHLAAEPIVETQARVAIEPGEACEVCRWDADHPSMLLCDACDRAFHIGCLTPPLERIPRGQWICDECIVSTGGDYGFEEGDEHTFQSYKRRADAFKDMWLQCHPAPAFVPSGDAPIEAPPSQLKMASWISDDVSPYKRKPIQHLDDDDISVASSPSPRDNDEPDLMPDSSGPEATSWEERLHIEDHMEREFWRLVESQHETVEVEYGADLHSNQYGSAFPALERHPVEPYARDGWNLNNLPIMSGSLLRYIKSDISGMTNPWLYVGMAFSTFAWHKEDHYTYSINYHHVGETKTWYGVPGEDDEKLEAAVKMAAPELFEQQPDLMFQLVTLMSPGRLKKQGVRVTACDQRPGEYVLTFPKAYHAGFNQGVNLCEAVNFCLPDWLPHGLECVQHYQKLAKHPVFSHDELLVTVCAYEKGSIASRWLYPHFKDMVDRELGDRGRIRHQYPQIDESIEKVDKNSEEQYQCCACNAFIYLSQVVDASGKAACADHLDHLDPGARTLRLRFEEEELNQMLQRIRARADKGPKTVSLLGAPDKEESEQRKSGRKRIASAALREALGEELVGAADRAKRTRPSLPSGLAYREELDSEQGGDNMNVDDQ